MLRRGLRDDAVALVLIAGGGALGTYARYATDLAVGHALVGTFLANVVGCFLLGLVLFDVRAEELLTKRYRLLFGTGFCASFTTFSTFALDVASSSPLVALAYVGASYGCGFGAVLASRAFLEVLGSTPVGPPSRGER